MFAGIWRAYLERVKYLTSCNGNAGSNCNELLSTLFWLSLGFQLAYYYFAKFAKMFLKAYQVEHYKWKHTIRSMWNISFLTVALIFLHVYRKTFLATSLFFTADAYDNYRIYENQLLHSANKNCFIFYWVTLLLMAFYVTAVICDLTDSSFTEVAVKTLHCCILATFNYFRLENYSITFNMILCSYYIFMECSHVLCWFVTPANNTAFRTCVILKMVIWSYIFLSLLPFNYLIPTLYARKFNLWVNIFLWLWYGISVWNSPILRCFCHQFYHNHNPNDCTGANSLWTCIVIRESGEIQHMRKLQKALIELNLDGKHDKTKTENSSSAAYQTIKCMIALKRKLRRIREHRGRNANHHGIS